MREPPAGYRLYAPVLERIGADFRPEGTGLSFECPFRDRHSKHRLNAFVKIGDRGELVARCNGCGANWRDFVRFVGLPPFMWWPDQGRKRRMQPATNCKAVEEYAYRDRDGNLLAVKVRWEPGFDGQRKKDFSWKRPISDPTHLAFLHAQTVPKDAPCWAVGGGCMDQGTFRGAPKGPVWQFRKLDDPKAPQTGPSILLPEVKLSLYRLPELWSANEAQPVIVVEGERKADRLTALGFVAVSGYAGKGKWDRSWGQHFTARRVVVIRDIEPGDAGREYADKVVASAVHYSAASVRSVAIPTTELPGGVGDIVDWLRFKFPGGYSPKVPQSVTEVRKEVSQLCRRTPEYKVVMP